MKANQKFLEADEAVSPVIGVILMVAITVVLAAVVFVLVSDLGDTGDSAPNVAFQKDEADDELSVVNADPGVAWTEFSIRGPTNIKYMVNDDADILTGEPLTTSGAAFTADGDISGGDTISFCREVGSSEASVTVTISHLESNSQIASFDFTTIAQCA